MPDNSVDDTRERKGTFLLVFGSILLLGLGSLGGWYGYQEFLRKSAAPVVAAPESRFIAAQHTVNINIASTSPDALISAITAESAGLSSSELKHFILRRGGTTASPLASTTDFFAFLGADAPGSLVRSFEDIFMLGSVGESRFIIFKLASFENAFGGMLNWEKDMARDIGDLFKSGPALKGIGSEPVFRDVISRNKDARVLYVQTLEGASSTEPALLYSFFDNQMLIITDSLETLQILVDRLTQELLSR